MEKHILTPFIPNDTKALMLGSFPPKKEKWTMDFYYPNFQNDMWRIFGFVFFNDKNHFLDDSQKKFDKQKIQSFLSDKKIGVGDSALIVNRLKDNASDKFLEVLEPLNFIEVLKANPSCNALISTGEKSTTIIQEYFNISKLPSVGEKILFEYQNMNIKLYRAPSSSRAYPKSIEDKANIYKKIFDDLCL